jgi:ElaB/YqjD/DUF883 family membrane-anchored ribosome-binding protein
MQKVRDPAANAVADLRQYGTAMQDDLAERGRSASGAFRNASRSASRNARRLGREITHGYEAARDYTSRGANEAWTTVQRHPTASIAIAVGLGVLIGGLMLSRRSR